MRKLMTMAIVVAMLTLGTACGTKDNADDRSSDTSTSQTSERGGSQLESSWSYQGSKVGSAKPGDTNENLLDTSLYVDPISLNESYGGTEKLVVNKHFASNGDPVRLAVSHHNNEDKWGEKLVITTRVDKPGQDKLYDQFKGALGPCALPFTDTLPTGIQKAFWIHNSMGLKTGVVYYAYGVTASMNFSEPQSKELFLVQLAKIAPNMKTLYTMAYGHTPAS